MVRGSFFSRKALHEVSGSDIIISPFPSLSPLAKSTVFVDGKEMMRLHTPQYVDRHVSHIVSMHRPRPSSPPPVDDPPRAVRGVVEDENNDAEGGGRHSSLPKKGQTGHGTTSRLQRVPPASSLCSHAWNARTCTQKEREEKKMKKDKRKM